MCLLLQPPLVGAAPPVDGLGPPEKVEIASAEASIVQYIGLLTVTIVAFAALAKKTLEGFGEGEVYWLPLLGALVTGYFTYEGWYYLQLQSYVNKVQRPQSRVSRLCRAYVCIMTECRVFLYHVSAAFHYSMKGLRKCSM